MPDFDRPFSPLVGIRTPTKPLSPKLKSNNRANNRSFFEEQLWEKRREKELEKMAQTQVREKYEREQIRKIRKQMEFKAQSISYSWFTLQKSTKPLTIPRSPKLGLENRISTPNANENSNPNISPIREHFEASTILQTSGISDENSFDFDFKFC